MSDEQEGQPGLAETGLTPEAAALIASIIEAPAPEPEVEEKVATQDKPGIREADARRARGFRRGITSYETR